MTNFRIFKQVPKLIFGEGSLSRLDELLPLKARAEDYYLFVVDDVLSKNIIINKAISGEGDLIHWFPASLGEPSTQQVDELCDSVINLKNRVAPIAIIGVGGGSTLDIAKAASVMFRNPGSSSEYQGWDLVKSPGVYKIGVPTIAGSGSEASRTAVLMGKERKFGINSDYSMFDSLILDSSLISTVTANQRFFSGMDCYIHCIESLNGTMINEIARGYAAKALELCENVFLNDGNNDQLMVASYFGGVSIVNSEVGVCHALSYGLSMELGFRHGLANCVAFKVLGDYYPNAMESFNKMIDVSEINLPTNVCKGLSESAMDKMVEMTLRMERPLTNALGADWKEMLTRDQILKLYQAM